LLTSHVWRQEHNGNSHEDPGFIDHVCNKKSNIVRVYLPPDANSLLVVTNHVLSTYNRINVIVAGKQPSPQWLDMPTAIANVELGINIWRWASNDMDGKADVRRILRVVEKVIYCAARALHRL
jgi:xylulose-5-phosphate/fructose-6-phosphate phosphoketolase